MTVTSLSRYYDLKLNYHRYYISPAEFKKEILNKSEQLEKIAIDKVTISKEAYIKYYNTYC